ncbi:restriction endonuclease [Paenibacillus chitinolyticus]|uniref:restriction endonuclease n=1 Tax=Paenibacillus chitinolyticus TaxID=79263 RepID=UPI003556D9E1
MKYIEDAGLVMAYIKATIDTENDFVYTKTVDNLKYPFSDFIQTILTEDRVFNEGQEEMKLFTIMGSKERINEIKESFVDEIKKVFNLFVQRKITLEMLAARINKDELPSLEQFLYLYIYHLFTSATLKYPYSHFIGIDEDCGIAIFYGTESAKENISDMVDHAMDFWLERECPIVRGKQVLIKSFLTNDLKGRRIITTFPNPSDGTWCLLLEGGIVFPLDQYASEKAKLNSGHIGQWTIGEVEEKMINPVYGCGYWFESLELFLEWQYAFLYALATLKIDHYEIRKFEELYDEFISFIHNYICPAELVKDTLTNRTTFINVLIRYIRNIEKYLTGVEDTGISKNIIFMMRNRQVYLPKVYGIISNYYNLEVENRLKSEVFEKERWGELILSLDDGNHFSRGVNLEALAHYFIGSISGLLITGTRILLEREEIDICCSNVSFDSNLWKLGPLVLVECKNRKNKLRVSDIRNLIPIMESKGINSVIFFTRSGTTKTADKEIDNQYFSGRTIICLDIGDFVAIKNDGSHPYSILAKKLKNIESRFENDIRLLY